MKSLQVDILGQVFPVFSSRNHLENDLGHQVFSILNNDAERPGIPAQNPVYQLFVFRIISNTMVHVLDQTADREFCCNKSKLLTG